jgi:hypothetical protein
MDNDRVKPEIYFLAPGDIMLPQGPLQCEVLERVRGVLRPGSTYLWVSIEPRLRASFRDELASDHEQLLLSPFHPGDLPKVRAGNPQIVEIVLAPAPAAGVVDERDCSKLGLGELYRTRAEAARAN